ncbi:DUF6275 family protein [Streptococcus lutetiensis]|uniref:DUF6275 family protein n=1 Tax=Streptococcus lutetiensis TaxID=150055 RepID=UPI001BDA5FE9|nr:DUF6275 family protein [Streptococcus lutetiensis]MBT0932893.1 hypothetical protein [Streptococcus lutetiensis]MDU2563781.1 DUF6275 family protein [Streptococcus lutetiensis]
MKEELIKMTQADFEVYAKHKISEHLELEPNDVYMVWFNYTLGNAKGMFSFDSEKAYPMTVRTGRKRPKSPHIYVPQPLKRVKGIIIVPLIQKSALVGS